MPQPTPIPEQTGLLQTLLGNPLAIAIILVVALVLLWLVMRLLRGRKPTPEACAKCGKDLTNTPPGPCPDCG